MTIIRSVDIGHIDTHRSTNLVTRGPYRQQVYRARGGGGVKAQWDIGLY